MEMLKYTSQFGNVVGKVGFGEHKCLTNEDNGFPLATSTHYIPMFFFVLVHLIVTISQQVVKHTHTQQVDRVLSGGR